jgi:hypothetical protein
MSPVLSTLFEIFVLFTIAPMWAGYKIWVHAWCGYIILKLIQ